MTDEIITAATALFFTFRYLIPIGISIALKMVSSLMPAISARHTKETDGLKASPLYIAFMIMHPIIRIAIAEDTISISFTGT